VGSTSTGPGFPIYEVRGQRIVLDNDLARLFGVQTFRLNEQLTRNLDRFSGYAFQLTAGEFAALTERRRRGLEFRKAAVLIGVDEETGRDGSAGNERQPASRFRLWIGYQDCPWRQRMCGD